jgi:predicted DsbA family dithiol-disulfide isomerase
MSVLRIDYIADVVCPWCWLGWVRLRKAIDMRPDVRAAVAWRSYQLDPSIPETGVDRNAYMTARYPDPERRAQMGERLREAAAEDGINLDLGRHARQPNTAAVHRVIRWAQAQGRGADAVDAAFEAYFKHGRDLGDPEVLADIGQAAGLDRLLVLELLSEGVDADAVRQEHEAAADAGVTGVPFIVFDGRLAMVGADTPERLVEAIDRTLARRARGPGQPDEA